MPLKLATAVKAPLILRSDLLVASRRMDVLASWFETALKKRLLTMRRL